MLAEVADVRGRPNFNGAAQEAVMQLNGWEPLRGTFRSLLDRAADKDERMTREELGMIAAYRRVYDFLRCIDRAGSERIAAQRDFREHIAWLRSSPYLVAFLRAERSRLLVAAGQPVRP